MSCFIFPDRLFLPGRLLAFGEMYQLRSHGITGFSFRCYSLQQIPPWPRFWTTDSFSHRLLQPQDICFSQPHNNREKKMKAQRLEKWKQKAAKHYRDKQTGADRVQDLPGTCPVGATFSNGLSPGSQMPGKQRGRRDGRSACQHCPLLRRVKVHQSSFGSYLMTEGLFHKHLAAGDRHRATGHEISSSPISPVCSCFCDGPKTSPYFLGYQGRHTRSPACWKAWILKTAK